MFSYSGNIIRLQLPGSVPGKFLFSALIFILIFATIWVNYFSSWMAATSSTWHNFLNHFLLYLALFATPFFIQRCFFGANNFTQSGFFYVIIIAAPLAFACRVSMPLEGYLNGFSNLNRLIITRAIKTMFLLLCTAGLWYGTGSLKNMQQVFRRPAASWRYLLWLLPMIPVIIFAAWQPSFNAAYPLVLKAGGSEDYSLAGSMMYEFIYITDIAGTEFFFRGLLVIALTKICGPRAIIPAACFYCAIHFGKPMAEAISSLFGGLFLGLLSYYTKTIWVCILLHAGIAVLMELLAFISLS